MKPRRPLLALALLIASPCADAQTIYFADGRSVPLSEAKISGTTIALPLKLKEGGASGEIRLPISSVARVDWPAPPELTEAESRLIAGEAGEALVGIDAVLPVHEPFKDVPGSWWHRATIVRLEAFARLGRRVDAEVELERLRRSKSGTTLVPRGIVAIAASLAETGKAGEARDLLTLVDRDSASDALKARLALVDGRIYAASGDTEAALLAFLRVPVLFPTQREPQSAALLEAILCYRAMNEPARADALRVRLLRLYPDSPEVKRLRAQETSAAFHHDT